MLKIPEFKYHVGVDPAWKNLGLSIIKENVNTKELHLVYSCVMNPSEFSSISQFVYELNNTIGSTIDNDAECGFFLSTATIERFVAYAGVSTAETENICMIIGALQYMFTQEWEVEPVMIRAIDWKTTLVKELHKQKGFDNPSMKLDKKFSDAAAVSCLNLPKKLPTDHESDASCLASYQVITGKKNDTRKT